MFRRPRELTVEWGCFALFCLGHIVGGVHIDRANDTSVHLFIGEPSETPLEHRGPYGSLVDIVLSTNALNYYPLAIRPYATTTTAPSSLYHTSRK
jgi:hypothetical protein